MTAKKSKPKKAAAGPGRPYSGGARPIVGVRLSESDLAKVDALAEREGVKRSEMVRKLLEAGLKALSGRAAK